MKMSRSISLISPGLLALSLGLITACGNSDSTPAGAAGSANASGAAGATDAGAAGSGNAAGNAGVGNAGSGGGAPPVVPGHPCPTTAIPNLALQEIASGLNQPLFVLSHPKDANKLFVVQKTGQIMSLDGAQGLASTPVQWYNLPVETNSELGLLGMAFHPNFGEAGEDRVYISYTPEGSPLSIRVASLKVEADGSVDATSLTTIFEESQPAANHNGGMIAFGPDGLLYLGLGDGGGRDDQHGNAQNTATRLGSMVRIDVDQIESAPPGGIAANPWIYYSGLRNPWRFSFDRQKGDLYIGDVGQDAWEEIDIVAFNDKSNHNFGWPLREGFVAGPVSGDNVGFTDPVLTYPRNQGKSVTGGYVYTGDKIPGLKGRYLYADFELGNIFSFVWDGTKICAEEDLTESIDPTGIAIALSSFGEDADGELYLVSMGSAQSASKIFRIIAKP